MVAFEIVVILPKANVLFVFGQNTSTGNPNRLLKVRSSLEMSDFDFSLFNNMKYTPFYISEYYKM